MSPSPYLNELSVVAESDVNALIKAEKSYGDSWKKRGGVGAFMMLARKWDRLENYLSKQTSKYDVFEAIRQDQRAEGVIDDIRDLRRYLTLIEAEARASGFCPDALAKDLEDGTASKGRSCSSTWSFATVIARRLFAEANASVISEVKLGLGLLGSPSIDDIPPVLREEFAKRLIAAYEKLGEHPLDVDDTPSAASLHPR